MLTRHQPDEGLEEVIDVLIVRMTTEDFDPKLFAEQVDQLTKLYKLKENHTPKRVSPDTLALVLGNLIGIVIILGYERAHVVTSKALTFVLRSR